MKPITEISKLAPHRNLTGVPLMKKTFGKNGLPQLHAIGTAPPTRSKKVIADAIMARANKDCLSLDQVLRRGINDNVNDLAIQHELDMANLDE